MIRLYQCCISPIKRSVFGPMAGCRFYPSCSEYAIGAIKSHGLKHGLLLAVWRLLRCHPFSAGGFDPVPEPRCKLSLGATDVGKNTGSKKKS